MFARRLPSNVWAEGDEGQGACALQELYVLLAGLAVVGHSLVVQMALEVVEEGAGGRGRLGTTLALV